MSPSPDPRDNSVFSSIVLRVPREQKGRLVRASRARGMTLAAWILEHLEHAAAAEAAAPACPAGFTTLGADEIPIPGDKAWNPVVGKWQTVTIPSMWLAGGARIKGTIFCRNSNSSQLKTE